MNVKHGIFTFKVQWDKRYTRDCYTIEGTSRVQKLI